MENKCKNKNCQRILPKGYKYKYCENCRNEKANNAKKVAKGVGAVGGFVGGIVLAVITKGKFKPGGKA